MRHVKAQSRGWVSILLVLFLCATACMSEDMGPALIAYSPTASSNEQAGRQTPGYGGYFSNRAAAANFMMTPARYADPLQTGECVRHLSALESSLPSMNITSYHAVYTFSYQKPRSELASRTGGHSPP